MRVAFASCLAVALLLAGCFSGGAPEEGPAVEDAPSVLAENATVDDGTTEMSPELGHQPHIHDYWQGKERVTLMDEDVEAETFTTLGFTFFNVVRGRPSVGGAFFTLPDGAIVFEGTGKLELTASWSDPTVTGVGLSYRSPASDQFSALQPLSQGQPFILDVTPEMCDMPHEKDSRWQFLLMPSQAGQAMAGKVHVRIDIVRMRDIGTFPGHPELFQGAHTLTLFQGTAQSTQSSGPAQFLRFVTAQGAQQASGVQSEKVVPMETLSMTANVTIKSATTSLGEVSDVTLIYKPAGSRGFQQAQKLSGDLSTGVFQFGWPVEMRQTDSPYAKTSQWRFDLRVSTDPTGTGGQCGGCSDAQVEYDLEVVAYDALVDGVAPPEDD